MFLSLQLYVGNVKSFIQKEMLSSRDCILQVVKVKVNKPKIQCGGDSLKIYDYQNGMIGRELASICGNKKKVIVTSSTNGVYIIFTSDGSGSDKGFKLKYQWKKAPKGRIRLTSRV